MQTMSANVALISHTWVAKRVRYIVDINFLAHTHSYKDLQNIATIVTHIISSNVWVTTQRKKNFKSITKNIIIIKLA